MLSSALLCFVVAITDGDTLTARCADKTIKVRLTEIDAPERKQPFGQVSKQTLADMCFKQNAKITSAGTDRYNRTLGLVECRGQIANRRMVQMGMAWMYDQYATKRDWYADQSAARAAKRGLWRDPNPTPPWVWRKNKKINQPKEPL